MANWTLGTLEFNTSPSHVSDLLTPERHAASVRTFTSVAFFSWGVSIVGKTVELTWDLIDSDFYDDLVDLVIADAPVTLDPQNGKLYQVELLTPRAEYFVTLTGGHRQNAVLPLLFLSESDKVI